MQLSVLQLETLNPSQKRNAEALRAIIVTTNNTANDRAALCGKVFVKLDKMVRESVDMIMETCGTGNVFTGTGVNVAQGF